MAIDTELQTARTGLTSAQYRGLLKHSPARRGGKESDVLRACLDLLRLRSIFAWRNNNAGVNRTDKGGRQFWTHTGLKGISDILGVLPDGRFLAIEVKRPGERPTREQVEFIESVRDNNGAACWVDSVDALDAQLRAWRL